MRHMFQPIEIPSDHTFIVTDVCIHNPENINICELVAGQAHYCTVLLLQQNELVLVNMGNLF